MAPPDPHVIWRRPGQAQPQQQEEQQQPGSPPRSPFVIWDRSRRSGGAAAGTRVPPRSMLVEVECHNCGRPMRGIYCSNCGHKPDEPATIGTLLYEQLIEERLNDGFAYLKALWFIVVCPRHFFNGVLIQRTLLPNDRWLLGGAWKRVSHKVQDVADPVRFVAISFGILLLLKVTGVIHEEPGATESVPEWAQTLIHSDMIMHEVEILLMLIGVAIYSYALSIILGERISTSDITRFFLYLSGIVALVGGILPEIVDDEVTMTLTIVGVWAYLLILTYVVLPRLYSITRKRLLASQFGALLLLLGAAAFLAFVAGVLEGITGAS
ncbi:hypothetical protein [Longimicrobium sp.]|uniref:hypothetical protein n=1 Tax=Longimicrobium sp. TaxID=2029185 RepID=UPI002CFCF68D|nr:hypothetical protein [Longimicrobium sp.]HSU16178.1 hypothetical protein [Longimicrobium sp.]